ncbi:hypothetical protein K8353_48250, partial [Burkholderia contaminans]|nr:hypothetical protein [Burkholderia contaminans]
EPDESQSAKRSDDDDPTQSERRLQHELHRVKPVEKKAPIDNEFEQPDDTDEGDAVRNRRMLRQMQGLARQVSLDPGDNMEL